MAGIRFGLILIIAAGLVVFTVQNLSPSLPLVFLAGRTQAFPLAFWLLAAIALGALTTLLIAGLTGLGASARRKTQRPRFTEPSGGASASRTYGFSAAEGDRTVIQDPPPKTAQATAQNTPQNTTQATPQDSAPRRGPASWMPNFGWGSGSSSREKSDWTDAPSQEEWEDWSGYDELNRPDVAHRVMNEDLDEFYDLEDEFQPSPQPEARSRPTSDWAAQSPPRSEPAPRTPEPEPPPRDYEVQQEPKKVYRSGSIYSYSYRNAEETGVGRSEDVFTKPESDPPQNESPEFSNSESRSQPYDDSSDFETASAYDESEDLDQGYEEVQVHEQPPYPEENTQDSSSSESEQSDYSESFETEASSDVDYGPSQDSYASSYEASSYEDEYEEQYEDETDYADESDIEPELESNQPLEPIDPSLSVYDAEYRVIVPPYQDLDDEEDLEGPFEEDPLADEFEEDLVDDSIDDLVDGSADDDLAYDSAYRSYADESPYRSEPDGSPDAPEEDWDELDDWPEEAYTSEPLPEQSPAPASASPDLANPESDLEGESAMGADSAPESDAESWEDWDDWSGFVEQDPPNDRWSDEDETPPSRDRP